MRIDAAERHFCRTVALGTVGLHAPAGEVIHQSLLFTAVKLLQGHVRDLPELLKALNEPFRQLHRQGVFQALVRVSGALVVKKCIQIALRQHVDGDELARLPVAGDLQHRRAREAAVGEEQAFTKHRSIFGCDNCWHRHAGEERQLLQQRLVQGERHQARPRWQHLQAKLLGNFIAKRRCAQARHRQATAGDHQLVGYDAFTVEL